MSFHDKIRKEILLILRIKKRVKMYKIIACDMDETLLNDDTHVSQSNRLAIQKARTHGVKFVPATGRSFRDIEPTLKELNLFNEEDQYVISYNGGCLTENKNNHILYFHGLDFAKADQLYQLGRKYKVCIHVYTKNMLYMYNAGQDEIAYSRPRHQFKLIDQPNLNFLKGQDIAKVLYQNTDQNYLQQVAAKMKDITKDLAVSYSSNRYLEFNPQGIDKGSGLKKLAGLLNVPISQTMAIGDNLNDLPMLKAANLGIGVANVNPVMKKDCDFITKADNNHGGVAEAINKFVLKTDH